MKSVNSYQQFSDLVKQQNRYFLLLYKSDNDISDCAYSTIERAEINMESTPLSIFTADAQVVRDIHPKYGITSVPSLLVFENGKHINTIKGCHSIDYYQSLFANALYYAKAEAEGRHAKQVTVYSTPTCTWCNTLKNWLRKNNIVFTDVDVSRSQTAAEELVSRTGQQGVPQTEIDGQYVIGFDQVKLKKLLEL
jgi:glutaredoxin-like YruB-family protein